MDWVERMAIGYLEDQAFDRMRDRILSDLEEGYSAEWVLFDDHELARAEDGWALLPGYVVYNESFDMIFHAWGSENRIEAVYEFQLWREFTHPVHSARVAITCRDKSLLAEVRDRVTHIRPIHGCPLPVMPEETVSDSVSVRAKKLDVCVDLAGEAERPRVIDNEYHERVARLFAEGTYPSFVRDCEYAFDRGISMNTIAAERYDAHLCDDGILLPGFLAYNERSSESWLAYVHLTGRSRKWTLLGLRREAHCGNFLRHGWDWRPTDRSYTVRFWIGRVAIYWDDTRDSIEFRPVSTAEYEYLVLPWPDVSLSYSARSPLTDSKKLSVYYAERFHPEIVQTLRECDSQQSLLRRADDLGLSTSQEGVHLPSWLLGLRDIPTWRPGKVTRHFMTRISLDVLHGPSRESAVADYRAFVARYWPRPDVATPVPIYSARITLRWLDDGSLEYDLGRYEVDEAVIQPYYDPPAEPGIAIWV